LFLIEKVGCGVCFCGGGRKGGGGGGGGGGGESAGKVFVGR